MTGAYAEAGISGGQNNALWHLERLAGRVGEGVGVSEFVCGARKDGPRAAGRDPLTLTRAAHAGRDTLVATAHALAHPSRLPSLPIPDKPYMARHLEFCNLPREW